MLAFIIGLLGNLISLIGWFVFDSLFLLILGTVFCLIETLFEREMLNTNAKLVDFIIFCIGICAGIMTNMPFHIGGMLAINIYSAFINLLSVPFYISLIIMLFKKK